uniref:Receptor ligand binding region domain-containing protein n=1 Tax=Acrobeloides nanus TaxID=290746 RepID=A0A914CU53_9BILA
MVHKKTERASRRTILVVCFESSDDPTVNDRRNFLLAMSEMGMVTSEYVIIYLETESSDDPTVNDRRNFLLAMSEMGMVTSEYVIIYLETWRQQGLGLPTPMWVDSNTPPDGQDAVAKQAANIALATWKPQYTDETSAIWKNWGGKRPLSTPVCGFDGNKCPLPFIQQYLGIVIAVIIIGIGLICAALGLIFYAY